MARISAAERSRIGVWPSTKQDFQLESITRWPMPEESAWRDLPSKAPRDISREEWIAERMIHALNTLREVVDVDPEIRGGVPVLMGTRFSLAQVLAEIADGEDIGGISEDLDLDRSTLEKLLRGLSILMDRSFFKRTLSSSIRTRIARIWREIV